MSDDEDDNSYVPEMDYDMWEGQFEFIGPTDYNFTPQGLLRPPHHLPYSVNGVKKTPAHQWCEEVSDQVRQSVTNLHICDATRRRCTGMCKLLCNSRLH
jgi:hypothetical protein